MNKAVYDVVLTWLRKPVHERKKIMIVAHAETSNTLQSEYFDAVVEAFRDSCLSSTEPQTAVLCDEITFVYLKKYGIDSTHRLLPTTTVAILSSSLPDNVVQQCTTVLSISRLNAKHLQSHLASHKNVALVDIISPPSIDYSSRSC